MADTLPPPALREAARRLHGESDLGRAVGWVLDAVCELAATATAAVCLLSDDGEPAWHQSSNCRHDFSALGDPRAPRLLGAALDVSAGVLYDDLAGKEPDLDESDRLHHLLPVDHLAVAPVSGCSELRGALLVGWDDTDIGPERRQWVKEVAATLASHLGIALDNIETRIRLAEEEARGKEVVHRLQEAVRPKPPATKEIDFGVHYVAADPSAPTGGDLYDWVLLPDGALHVAIVDVMGKGVQATKDALMVTHALRLLAIDGCPLDDMVRRADDLVAAQNPDLVATLVIGRYDPTTGNVRLAGAGHPPALIVNDGEPRELAAPGIPIGWPGAGSHEIVEANLAPHDTLVLYTDGLIEARKDIVQGLEELTEAVRATAHYPAKPMARVLIDRQLAGAMRHDDSVALIVRRLVPHSNVVPLGPFVHRFSPHTAAVQVARHLLREWLDRVPVRPHDLDSILLAASELSANAVRHSSGRPSSVEVAAWVTDGAVTIEVSDDGGSTLPESLDFLDVPDMDAEQGRGLFLVRELMDEVVTAVVADRTVVRATKRAAVAERLASPDRAT